MNRALALGAVLAAGLSLPAIAGEKSAAISGNADVVAAHSAELSVAANANQARKILLSQGYVNVSELSRDANGRWTGTAIKDGTTTVVAVVLPPKPLSGSVQTN